jgi:hypothetical protein
VGGFPSTFKTLIYIHGRGGLLMNITTGAVREKIAEMYPQIDKNQIILSVDFDAAKDAYVVKFKKDKHELTTHLEKKDAEACLRNIECVYLGTQIGQFIKNFEKV